MWETTHVGGDRFAPNVVSLPDGSYHVGVTVADVPALAEAITSGRVLPSRLRGRAGMPAAAQAADCFVREHTGETSLAAVRVVAAASGPDGETCVELLVRGRRWCVHAVSVTATQERLTSCAGTGTLGTPARFELVSLRRLA